MSQITNNIMMIQPVGFRYNEQTAVNNYYQRVMEGLTPARAQENALQEFNGFVEKLRAKGVNVVVIPDTKDPDTPDSIFPNNWVSFHRNSVVGLYPMCAENRRDERREDILETLVDDYGFHIEEIKDFTEFEEHDKFLEGTGSMILDRENKLCYAAISIRTDEQAVIQFCDEFGYEPVCFTANQDVNGERLAIYHTNVMMCLSAEYSVICLDSVNEEHRESVVAALIKTGHEIIELSMDQMYAFAGNMIEALDVYGNSVLVMSETALKSLSVDQKQSLSNYSQLLSIQIKMQIFMKLI